MSGGKFWSGSRPRRDRGEAPLATAAGWQPTAVDRCDRCGAQAYVRAFLPSYRELLFCAHHYRQHAPVLAQVAVEIRDETKRLAQGEWLASPS